MSDPPWVVLIGTCDTKLEELLFLRECILRNDAHVLLVDVGRSFTTHNAIDIGQDILFNDFGDGIEVEPAWHRSEFVSKLPRGDFIKAMAGCATKAVKNLLNTSMCDAVVSAGGSGGTSLAAEVMRNALPIGLPKLIVSTIASGDTGPIVGETDITMMYSVVDVAGLNQVLRQVLNNAAAAIAGMARAYRSRNKAVARPKKKRVGITMFGVTTPAVDAIRRHLEAKYDVETYVFHATGHGGKAMERLVQEKGLDAVLDLTTTEICDYITGGVMSAGEHRLEAAARAGIPNIISVGATDMTNFGPKATVPEHYKDRKLYEHNPVVTLMRTSESEARQVGEFITTQLKKHATKPQKVQVWLPKGGISMIATPGGPFEDAKADAALFDTIKNGLEGSGIDVVEDDRPINDEGFALDIANALVATMKIRPKF